MTKEDVIANQKLERSIALENILSSKSKKKIILAGAGTGKTFTFKQVLRANPEGNNIALTFIRILSNDMNMSFGELAEVKTFHAFCKKVLHEQNGKVELVPFLTKIIEEDAIFFNLPLNSFDAKFQMLDEESPELKFYLRRGDYYDSVSFNDSVYRLYKALKNNPDIVPIFNQILIDEFQDFNLLEVAFINEIEKRGNILIVGDDDQAVYQGRNASPEHIRKKYKSKEYKIFELPFCSRCPQVIVDATNSFLSKAEQKGYLKGRAKKKYQCFLEAKENDSLRFPSIITAQCSTAVTVSKYIDQIIQNLDHEDIAESWEEESEYYSVLIVGAKQYLSIIQNKLVQKYPQLTYKVNEEKPLNVIDAYNILLRDIESNLGWRVIIGFYLKNKEVKKIVEETEKGKKIIEIINKSFLTQHYKVVEIIKIIKKDGDFTDELKAELKEITQPYYNEIIEYYTPTEKLEEDKPDKSKPSILLSSFVGCKGLSAGHVIIIGANNGSIPKKVNNIEDVEIAQFMVALTRTRKQCYIIANKWLLSPKVKGVFQQAFQKSLFIGWIPNKLIKDYGLLKADDLK